MMETHDCGYLTELSHRSCTASACDIDCIKNLNLHLEQYLDELSRVFFNKENMRIKQSWWLSTFYSFCIQGIIQRALKELKVTLSSEKAVDEYLPCYAAIHRQEWIIRSRDKTFCIPGEGKAIRITCCRPPSGPGCCAAIFMECEWDWIFWRLSQGPIRRYRGFSTLRNENNIKN
jgi:hypothetical protein